MKHQFVLFLIFLICRNSSYADGAILQKAESQSGPKHHIGIQFGTGFGDYISADPKVFGVQYLSGEKKGWMATYSMQFSNYESIYDNSYSRSFLISGGYFVNVYDWIKPFALLGISYTEYQIEYYDRWQGDYLLDYSNFENFVNPVLGAGINFFLRKMYFGIQVDEYNFFRTDWSSVHVSCTIGLHLKPR